MQFVEFTYCHNRYPHTTLKPNTTNMTHYKHLEMRRMESKPLNCHHNRSTRRRTQTRHHKAPKSHNTQTQHQKNIMNAIQQNAIKHIMYLILNKRKLDNYKRQCPPHPKILCLLLPNKACAPKRWNYSFPNILVTHDEVSR
jgi:hypothetical protein